MIGEFNEGTIYKETSRDGEVTQQELQLWRTHPSLKEEPRIDVPAFLSSLLLMAEPCRSEKTKGPD